MSLDLIDLFYAFSQSLFLSLSLSFSLFLSVSQSQDLKTDYAIERLEDYSFITCTLILIFSQTMAATKRNAGLTSAVPRATLNDEELVRTCPLVTVPHHRHSVSLFNKLREMCLFYNLKILSTAAPSIFKYYLKNWG